MYQLHISEKHISSWSLRVWALLLGCNVPFEEIVHQYRDDKSQQRAEWLQFSPTAKVPTLADGANVIWDSLAITEYVAEDYPQVWVAERSARAWSRSACAEMHSGFQEMRDICNFRLDQTVKPVITPALEMELQRINQLWNQGVTQFGGQFLAGKQFSAVDAFYLPIVVRIYAYQLQDYLTDHAKIYWQMMRDSALLQRWRAEAGHSSFY